jgi:dsRNA-specific ribonuclease
MNFSKKYPFQKYNQWNTLQPSNQPYKFFSRNSLVKKSDQYKEVKYHNNSKYLRKNAFKMEMLEQNGSKHKRNFDEMNEADSNQQQSNKKFNSTTNEAEDINLTDIINEVNNSNSSQSLMEESITKNSIQKLYEIKKIKKVSFDMLSTDGPSHKPSFKFALNFELKNKKFKFEGEGTNKKLAKSIASLKALYFLKCLPQFFSMFESIYIGNLIRNEMKSILGLTDNFEGYFLEALDQSQREFLESENKLQPHTNQVQTQNVEDKILKTSKLITDWDNKTKEILASKNSLIILNHLISNCKFELISETGSSHAKQFKIELKISKTTFEELKESKISFIKNSLLENSSSLFESESVLISSNESDLLFYGTGNSKKQAKSKAAQLAVESIFNVKIMPNGKRYT